MVMPAPGAGRRGLLSFRVFGFPVTIHASFLIVVLLFGYSGDTGLTAAFVWLGVVTVSVIAHELGHAAVAAPVGGEPRIDLYGMAGLTRWNPGRASRGRRVAVSLAGPGAGLLFGILVLFVRAAVAPAAGTLTAYALDGAVFANIAWGLLNLLPMLPLDGGQILHALMPGRDDVTRLRRASYASLGVAAAVAVAVIAAGAPILAALVVFFAAGNAQTLMALRRAKTGDPYAARVTSAVEAMDRGDPGAALAALPPVEHTPPQYAPAVTLLTAVALVRLGRAREAQDLLLTLPEGARVEPAFAATVLIANGQDRLGREQLAAALPVAQQWAVREAAALLLARGEDVEAALAGVTPAGAVGALTALYQGGAYEPAARFGEQALAAGVTEPLVAYNVACAWARAGQPDRALRALDDAAQLGWADVAQLDADADLASLRDLAAYDAVRARIAANAALKLATPPS
jgi:Zn-dependent protease